ncbi:hypothetical protein LWI28_015785 [Acer negundo]|uniref:Uncharacterized protein n=1 Tax=Acer negundo TaxID=4023 RepID=A0AAD5IE97_ACENE|nr:hypothetical protein LWI28_015785 [Acer negundo]
METIHGWLFSPINDQSFNNHDLAIRRFCPAGIEQEQKEWEETIMNYNEIDCLSPSDIDAISSSPHDHHHLATATSEIDYEFVDSFINMDDDDLDHDHDHKDTKSSEKHQIFENVVHDHDQIIGGDQVPNLTELGDQYFEVVPEMVPSSTVEEVSHGVDQGLHLVHLLLACAEAVGCRDTQLADSMLNQIWASANPWGDSLQRVSYCFALGLKSRLSLLHNNINANGTFSYGVTNVSLINREEKMEAFHLLYQTTPYIAFGFMAANEAISQAAQGKDSLHIIDLGMEHTLQWPSLLRSLASRPEGPPKIRISGLIHDQNRLEIETNMKILVQDAISSLGIALEFTLISEPVTTALLTEENLNLREGEALFVNSIMHLHKYVKESRGSLKAILQAIKKLNPTLLTVVEQDANHNGPFFLGRFLESLHYYSAIFDSLEACLPRNSPQRLNIERLHLAEEIRNIVAYEGSDRIERHERVDQWRRQLGRAGFQVVGLKCLSQARMMLSVYGCDGYTLGSEKGCLLLGWKGRPIMLASAWQVHNVSSS